PFRDTSASGERLVNLLACLDALRDQSAPSADYAVTVIECDTEQRWRATVEPRADEYLHAYKAGPFNRSWAVNAAVVNSASGASFVCVLDADALVDRHFVERNARRFSGPAVGAFLPFTDLLYLDTWSSRWAVEQRLDHGAASVDLGRVRGFLVHRASGMCVWLRREVFDAVGGYDERYEGWGGEDLDLVLRLQRATAFRYFDDPLLHMEHPVTPGIVDAQGNTTGVHPPMLTWRPEGPIGSLTAFAPPPVR
ncbi:glycosyltransferase family 2 protein, partial [Streptomyces sp. UH6]|uniref:glycosyltransferase n=1 Tax=Streptomyces sp. UH6 TaxID=2748379 RepID=UPI0015D4C4DB